MTAANCAALLEATCRNGNSTASRANTVLNAAAAAVAGWCDELLPKAGAFYLALVLIQLSSLRNLTRMCLHVVVHVVEDREGERREWA
jgi:hypothetical protein